MAELIGGLIEAFVGDAIVEGIGGWVKRPKRRRLYSSRTLIALCCCTVFLAVTSPVVLTVWVGLSDYQQRGEVSGDAMGYAMIGGLCGAAPLVVMLAFPLWLVLGIEPPARESTVGAEEFEDFARKLEEAKENRGTLVCFECGHHNPVGQPQCEGCGEWVPQTAKARWAYKPRADES